MEGLPEIRYQAGNELDLQQVIELYVASTLGERRPVNDLARMKEMLERANLVWTAWEGELLVGIARSLTDFVYATYVSDLAVRVSHQRTGIGKELLRRTKTSAPQASLVLLAAPAAAEYYSKVGFEHMPRAWMLPANQPIR
ncbi:MAG: GCN5-related N-acetyltransferase [Verrucomicrobiales bacterium]|nr:GCN5-related N-acetyltransferase [Verrucomicrobiales bacterium]